MPMHQFILLLTFTVQGCATTDKNEDSGAAFESQNIIPIAATVRILDAATGAGIADVSAISSIGSSSTTDGSGSATIDVAAGQNFSIQLEKEGALDHLLFGPAGQEDFDFVTFLATDSMVNMVTSMLGASPAPGTGVLVVGIDYDDLSAAAGASASIGAAHDNPWVIGAMGPAFGDTIPTGGMGMVAFPGVAPGDVSVDVSPPQDASCTAFPGNGEMPEVPVLENHVTVIAFHCR